MVALVKGMILEVQKNEAIRNHFYAKFLILTTFTQRDETFSHPISVR